MITDTERVSTDAEVIQRSREDPAAFATLFDRHAPALHRYVTRRLGDSLADDIVAETFLAAFTLNGGPAFAVDQRADGTIQVRISEFRDPAALERALGEHGIRAAVDYLPAGQTCEEPRGTPSRSGGLLRTGIGSAGDGFRFEIGKGQVAQDEMLVLAVSVAGPDEPPVATTLSVVKGAVPECVPVPLPAFTGEPGSEPGGGVTGRRGGGDGPSRDERLDGQGDGKGHRSRVESGPVNAG